jgi:hypothetical protein
MMSHLWNGGFLCEKSVFFLAVSSHGWDPYLCKKKKPTHVIRRPTTDVNRPLKTIPNIVRLIPANMSGSFSTNDSPGCSYAGPSESISYA